MILDKGYQASFYNSFIERLRERIDIKRYTALSSHEKSKIPQLVKLTEEIENASKRNKEIIEEDMQIVEREEGIKKLVHLCNNNSHDKGLALINYLTDWMATMPQKKSGQEIMQTMLEARTVYEKETKQDFLNHLFEKETPKEFMSYLTGNEYQKK